MSASSEATAPPVRGRGAAFVIAAVAAAVVAIGMLFLVVDWGIAMSRAPSEKARVDELREQVATDAAIAEALHEERERQTLASVARKERARVAAWILLVAGAVFVGAAKRHLASRPQPLPSLEEMVAVRFPPPAPSRHPAGSTGSVAEPETIDLAFVDALVERLGRSREAAIPILQAIQTHYRYLPDEALRRVCETTEITPAQIAGTSSFYAQFRRTPVGKHVVRVCHGTACHVAGAEQITNELKRHLEIPEGEDTDARRRFTIDAVACVGCCSLAPVMMIGDETAGRLTPSSARQTLESLEPSS
jgi:NADH:ubiquinone oxidoreductase subunit E